MSIFSPQNHVKKVVGSIRPNLDGRINKNQTAKNFNQTAETEGPNITIRPKMN